MRNSGLRPVAVDFETAPNPKRSEHADLKANGLAAYAATHVPVALAWQVPGGNPGGMAMPAGCDIKKALLLSDEGRKLAEAVRDRNCFVAHNAMFDTAFWDTYIEPHVKRPRQVVCTMNLAGAMNLPKSLDRLSKFLFGEGKVNSGENLINKIKKGASLTEEELADFLDYCKHDASLCLRCLNSMARLWVEEKKPSKQDPLFERFLLESAADLAINRAGMPVGKATVAKGVARRAALLEDANETVSRMTAGKVERCTMVQKAVNWLSGKVTLPDALLRSKSQETIAKVKSAVEASAPAYLPVVEALETGSFIAAGKWNKASERMFRDRLHCSYQFMSADTGRWSSYGIQLHNFTRPEENLPPLERASMGELSKSVRKAVEAPKGKVLVVADFSQIELRVLLALVGRIDLADAMHKGKDLYVHLARKIFSTQRVTKEQRRLAKQAMLGMGYGMRWNHPVLTAIASESMCRDAYDAYHKALPEVRRFWEAMEEAMHKTVRGGSAEERVGPVSLVRHNKALVTLRLGTGRHLYMWKPKWERGQMTFYAGEANRRPVLWGSSMTGYICQATARDVLARTLADLCQARKGRTALIRVVGHVHDEVIVEAPEREAETAEEMVREAMTGKVPCLLAGCPLDAEIRVGRSWA